MKVQKRPIDTRIPAHEAEVRTHRRVKRDLEIGLLRSKRDLVIRACLSASRASARGRA
jgi:hypothetical protein